MFNFPERHLSFKKSIERCSTEQPFIIRPIPQLWCEIKKLRISLTPKHGWEDLSQLANEAGNVSSVHNQMQSKNTIRY